ncbi:MAG TPA: acyloxyacyl hydrolase [Methylomirabilota bacterium]|nr:acyloxyacyl hydrolase [Methylomirabilota bacterium]
MSRRPGSPTVLAGVLLVVAVLAGPVPGVTYDSSEVWRKGTWVWSLEGAYGNQVNLENFRTFTDLEFVSVGARWSLLPFNIIAPDSVLRSAFEIGLEPLYMHYLNPDDAFYAGLAAVARYHFLRLGRFVPYLEGAAAVGGTNLDINEIDSDASILLIAGIGASVFITDHHALYAGYRFTHNSNGNTDSPNRGWEAHTGVVGVSFFFK